MDGGKELETFGGKLANFVSSLAAEELAIYHKILGHAPYRKVISGQAGGTLIWIDKHGRIHTDPIDPDSPAKEPTDSIGSFLEEKALAEQEIHA